MPKVRVHALTVSADGFVAGPDQDLEHPTGRGAEGIHDWIFETASGRAMIGMEGGSTGDANDIFAAGFDGIGATVMGRNTFGPVRGPWGAEAWDGWWGEEPPFGHEVFVLTHHAREDLQLSDTTFHFVTEGAWAALNLAKASAGGLDVRVTGGAQTLSTYLREGLVDELHLVRLPLELGAGASLDEASWADRYEVVERSPLGFGYHEHLELR